eukprot:scaffold8610_cov70-Cyclotella_meneghiniana.AAC.4
MTILARLFYSCTQEDTNMSMKQNKGTWMHEGYYTEVNILISNPKSKQATQNNNWYEEFFSFSPSHKCGPAGN